MQNPYHQDANDAADASTLGSRSIGAGVGVAGAGGGDEQDGGPNEEETLSTSVHAAGFVPSSAHALPRIVAAGEELESLCRAEMSGGRDSKTLGFPPTCLPIVGLLAGNHCCVDCGDEDPDRLGWASIGYGTILCQECATRHATMAEQEESAIKSLKDEHWNLRSTLVLLEGSNTRMLDYVKNKPRWKPPKGGQHGYSEDALAFKQIYLSKGAAAYRKTLGKRVDDIYYARITAMREMDAAREERLLLASTPATDAPDPFRRIFEQNDVGPKDVPGFFDLSAGRRHSEQDAANRIASNRAGMGGATDADVAASAPAPGLGKKGRRGSLSSMSRHEAPSVEMIKKKIERRRSMCSVNSMTRSLSPAAPSGAGRLGPNNVTSIAAAYLPQGNRKNFARGSRRMIEDYGVVGEVGDTSLQKVEDDQVSVGANSYQRMSVLSMGQKTWASKPKTRVQHDDDGTIATFQSRAVGAANMAPLGTYRRLNPGAGGGRGGGQ